jgi:para-aminobenzoate synthetase component I
MSPGVRETRYLEPEAWVATLPGGPGAALLRSHGPPGPGARHSFLAAEPLLVFRARGPRCEVVRGGRVETLYGSPWRLLEAWRARFELAGAEALPFPAGGCFGYWGYDLKHALEPRLPRVAVNDLELWDCWLGFYPSLLVFDHAARRSWIVATGFDAEATQHPALLAAQTARWLARLPQAEQRQAERDGAARAAAAAGTAPSKDAPERDAPALLAASGARSNVTPAAYLAGVRRALAYIGQGDIYQVNLSHRLAAPWRGTSWELYQALARISPAPHSAWLDCGECALASASPELFLRLDGREILTRPIKGTRPRGADAAADARLARELRQSPKENAELVMITDLLRNDLGGVCEYGTVRVPGLAELESFPQVHHLVSTVAGRLRPEVSHLDALARCFPGGSVTGAPKVRALEIIEELEPATRGPYTGCLGYLGFNQRSQWNILIRTALWQPGRAWWQTGGGIVADSDPAAEYLETLHKARGFLEALRAAPPA